MDFRTVASPELGVYAKVKLAQLFEMPEKEVEEQVRKLESDRLFKRLVQTGVVSIEPYPKARFGTRKCEAPSAAGSGSGLPGLEDADGNLSAVIEEIGEERFERCFLRDEAMSDIERARACGISEKAARRLRLYVDDLTLRADVEEPGQRLPDAKVYSVVAGIEVEAGRPVLGFFHRDVWKGRYRIDPERREAFLSSLPEGDGRRAERLLRKLEWVDRRKSTLYSVLDAILDAQAEYLASGDLDRRRPLTQRALAARVGVGPDVMNRLISNKALRLPGGREVAIKTLVPNAKSLLRDRLFDVATANPRLPDTALAEEMKRLYSARLSRRQVAKYRKELGLVARGRRDRGVTAS